jgi:hypothetical protein
MVPSTIERNKMYDCIDGFLLNWGIVGPQGCEKHPSDNEWHGNFTNHTYSYYSNGNNSPFYVRKKYFHNGISPLWKPWFYPDNMINENNWGFVPIEIIPTRGISFVHCFFLHLPPPVPHFPHQRPVMEKIAQGLINFPVYNHETKYMAKHGVYKHLINTSVNSPVLQQFKQQSDNGNLGLLEKVNNNLITGNYLQAQQFNNAISPAGIPENSLKTINDIYINNLINNSCFDSIISFTCAQTNVLKSIAQQCPYQYGKAVYQARMLLGFVDTAQYCNECEIIFPPSDNKRLIIGNKDNNDIVKLYPNPAKNEITIEFNYLIEENILFELYDVLGNKVMCRQLLRNNNKVNVSTKNLNQGIYFYKIILNNNIIASDKLVIIK